MILAAGFGTRMRPLTNSLPKPLLPVAGKPLIEYHIEALKKAGIKELVINTAYLADKIHDSLGDGSRFGVSISYSDESEPLETLGGIANALPLLGEEPFLVVNGDVYAEVDYTALIADFNQSGKLGHLLLVPNPDFNPEGDFAIEHGLLSNSLYQERYTFAGISVLSKALIDDSLIAEGPLAPLLRKAADKQLLSVSIFEESWFDVGTPARLHEVDDFIAAKNSVR